MTDDEINQLDPVNGRKVLGEQLQSIFTCHNMLKQTSLVEQFFHLLDKMKLNLDMFAKILNYQNPAKKHNKETNINPLLYDIISNGSDVSIEILRQLIKYNELNINISTDNAQTTALIAALSQAKDKFRIEIIEILLGNGCSVDENLPSNGDEEDYFFRPNAIYYCLDNEDYNEIQSNSIKFN